MRGFGRGGERGGEEGGGGDSRTLEASLVRYNGEADRLGVEEDFTFLSLCYPLPEREMEVFTESWTCKWWVLCSKVRRGSHDIVSTGATLRLPEKEGQWLYMYIVHVFFFLLILPLYGLFLSKDSISWITNRTTSSPRNNQIISVNKFSIISMWLKKNLHIHIL